MKTYAYFSFLEKVNLKRIYEEIMRYCVRNSLRLSKFLTPSGDLKRPIYERELLSILTKALSNKDALVVYEPANLGRSICQVIEVLKMALNRGVDIHFVKAGLVFRAETLQRREDVIQLLAYVTRTFASRRTSDQLVRRAWSRHKTLGRPKGRPNNRLKLDGYRDDIMRYLNLKVSKRSIAKLIDCHPQTLTEWLARRNISLIPEPLR